MTSSPDLYSAGWNSRLRESACGRVKKGPTNRISVVWVEMPRGTSPPWHYRLPAADVEVLAGRRPGDPSAPRCGRERPWWPDPADRRRTWFGRATARGGGWVLDMDALDPRRWPPGQAEAWGGYGITHAVSLSRPDASPFTADDAPKALHAVRSALNLILGRRADVVLPVGWSHDLPAWARWTSSPQSPPTDAGGLGDPALPSGGVLLMDGLADEHEQAPAGECLGGVASALLDRWPDLLAEGCLLVAGDVPHLRVPVLGDGADDGLEC
jgi:hypothetical protein